MAWTFQSVGTPSQVNTAVASLTASAATGQDSQLSRVKSIITAEVNAVGGSKVSVKATGHYDAQGSVINVTVQPVLADASGAIFSPPHKNS